ncbi:S1C family serine protease [Sciscionella sediminilitoris]|uniref:S1C family serine protease n=1 Tax=Sciscionella sediminilitoris TaxID=1445613 RepID=UPI000569F932|nr:trypsin-like peptidase domain-containing protein [Sciscionella sp. SE31]
MTENTPPQDEPQPQPQQPQPGQAWWQQHSATPPYGAAQQQQQPGAPQYTMPIGTVPGPERPKRKVTGPIVITALIAGLIGGGVGVGGSALFASGSDAPLLTSQPQSSSSVSTKPGSVSYAAEVALKSTVDIKTATQQGQGEGTGIVLTQDGYILTNNHVVAGADNGGRIQVTGPDGKKYSASIKGTAPSYDLAVIKLDGASGLTPAKLGQSSNLKVGQQVAAVGSPYGFTDSVTSGIVSALSRTVTAQSEDGQMVVYNALQTDASINFGNSGGPLVNMDGQVVGVNSAKYSGNGQSGQGQGQEDGGAQGIGYSIPIDTAKRVANELMQNGKATKPQLGVTGSVGSQGTAREGGAPLGEVSSGGAAEKAGIKQGDVVTKLGNTPISSYADLMAQVLKHQPGETIPVTVKHSDGSEQTVNVTLGSTTDTKQTTVSPQQENPFGGGGGNPFGGGNGGGGIPGFGGN